MAKRRTSTVKSLRARIAELEDDLADVIEDRDGLAQRLCDLSERCALNAFGKDRVDVAKAAIQHPRHSSDLDWVLKQDHPYDALLYWHRHYAMH